MPRSLCILSSSPQALGPHQAPRLCAVPCSRGHFKRDMAFGNFFPLRNLWLYIFLKGTPYLVFPLFTCCIVSDLLIHLQCWVWNTEPWVCGANILPLSLTAPSPILISVLSGLYFPRVCPIIKSLGAETGSDICAAAQGGLSSQTPVN